MGANLYFKTNSNPDEVANYLLEKSQLNKKLIEWDEQNIYINCKVDIEWAKEERPDMVNMYERQYGTGDIKTSGQYGSEKFIRAGYNSEEDLPEMWVMIFEELNERFEMKYYARSCSLTTDYFSVEQMKRITKNGELLSGKSSSKDYVVEKYNELYALLSEPEKVTFNISDIKENDTVFINEEWRKVIERYGHLSVQIGLNTCDTKPLEDTLELIEGHRKYVPKIRYNGAICDVEAYVKDGNTLLYLETTGQEYMVKSVTSVLMQGRVRMNDHAVDASFGHLDINKAGNRRKMIALDDGIAHAILYHSPSISEVGFNILIGRDANELLQAFSSWMEKSQPLPYPKDLTNQIFQKLKDRDKITELTSRNIEAVKVDITILENEYFDLQEIILEVCKENGLINPDAKPKKNKKENKKVA